MQFSGVRSSILAAYLYVCMCVRARLRACLPTSPVFVQFSRVLGSLQTLTGIFCFVTNFEQTVSLFTWTAFIDTTLLIINSHIHLSCCRYELLNRTGSTWLTDVTDGSVNSEWCQHGLYHLCQSLTAAGVYFYKPRRTIMRCNVYYYAAVKKCGWYRLTLKMYI